MPLPEGFDLDGPDFFPTPCAALNAGEPNFAFPPPGTFAIFAMVYPLTILSLRGFFGPNALRVPEAPSSM